MSLIEIAEYAPAAFYLLLVIHYVVLHGWRGLVETAREARRDRIPGDW